MRVKLPERSSTVALMCALVATFAALAVVLPALEAGGGTSSLVRLPREEALGQLVAGRHPDFRFVHPEARYDGRYFFAIAVDPFATGNVHRSIDAPAYRYGHPGYGWMAGVLSLGRSGAVPLTLLLIGFLGLAAAAAFASLLAPYFGMTPWTGLAVAVNPGLIYAVSANTSEAVAAGLLGASIWLWLRGRVPAAGITLILLCLTKEQFVVVPIGFAVWELLELRRGRTSRDLRRRLGWLSAGPAVLAAWFGYLYVNLGVWSFTEGPRNVGAPLVGWADTLRRAAGLSLDGANHQIGAIALPLLIAVAVTLLIGAAAALRLRSPVDPPFLGLVAIVSLLTWLALLYPKDLLRNVATLFYLMPFVIAGLSMPERESQRSGLGRSGRAA